MIKSELGTVEVTGLKPVVMAELVSLLEVLKRELGEELYNTVLQDANNSKQFGDEPEDKKADFEPHLLLERPGGKTVNFGRIGDETSIYDIMGNNLSVGDTVNLYNIEDNKRFDFRGERLIAKDGGSEFVMGTRGHEFDHGVSCDARCAIILNRRHTEIKDGETVDCIKYIKSERTGE